MKNVPYIHIVGCGGVGSWLTPSLRLLQPQSVIVLWDGDTLEEKNLNRQLFTESDLGHNKAEALALKYNCGHETRFFAYGGVVLSRRGWIFCCADNNRARREVLRTCDDCGCSAIVAANETHSAEAYCYRPEWVDSERDPRVYYPEIETDPTGDPMAAAIGCTGAAQLANTQLVSANFMAAALAQHLFVLHAMEAPAMSDEVRDQLPHKFVANLSKLENHKKGLRNPSDTERTNKCQLNRQEQPSGH